MRTVDESLFDLFEENLTTKQLYDKLIQVTKGLIVPKRLEIFQDLMNLNIGNIKK